ncbi:MAG TPA: HD domain-containing protein, partial [Planctomycetota bacterium]|nr:HD domain-containing protein [Planctomycetota bacterium]
RADTIVPAGVVYFRLAELAAVPTVLVPRVGIKDGLLKELIDGHLHSFAAEEHVDVLLSSCRALGRKYHFESEHAEAVLLLARQLFDQTRELHGLGERARVLLEAAALLHDLGVAVNNDGHHKHSQYLIQASDLVGLSDEERQIVALLARYHRKSSPSREHEEFAALRRRERSLVERLTAILRLADALDRQHAGLVRSVVVKIREDQVELQPILAAGQLSRLTLERKAVEEKGLLFAQLFGKPLRLFTP